MLTGEPVHIVDKRNKLHELSNDNGDVNMVMMLRPTESPVIFLQQLGRGLRPAPGKDRLTVIDFIGNHRSFLQRPGFELAEGVGTA